MEKIDVGIESAGQAMDVNSARQAMIQDKLEMILDVGQLLLESGSDSKCCVRDMLRAAAYLGLHWQQINFQLTYTTIMANYVGDRRSYTVFRKYRKHGINMATIIDVSRLSWRAIEEQFLPEAFHAHLQELKRKNEVRHYSPLIMALAAGIACGAFAKLFGGDWLAFWYTSLAACLGFCTRRWSDAAGINGYISIGLAAFVATMTAHLMSLLPGSATPWYPMISCMLFLVPGIPLINSFDDLVNNYFLSGLTRSANTALIIFAMTFGIVGSLSLWPLPDFTSYSLVPDGFTWSLCLATALAAIGFGILFNIPPKLLGIAGLGAVIAVGTRNLLQLEFAVPVTWASFWGAAVISIIGYRFAHWIRVPHVVVIIPAVIPMIPGVLMYRMLLGFFYISTLTPEGLLDAIQSGVQAAMIILAIAMGATIPDMLAHQFIERAKHRRLCHLLATSQAREDSALELETDIDQASNIR